jgi:hypothetical protein
VLELQLQGAEGEGGQLDGANDNQGPQLLGGEGGGRGQAITEQKCYNQSPCLIPNNAGLAPQSNIKLLRMRPLHFHTAAT